MSSDAIVRKANQGDLPSLIPLARRFVDETELPLTFDASSSASYMVGAMESEEFIFLVEEDNGIISGAIIGAVDKDFCKETCAYITKMYVEKEFRGLGTSRALVEAFQEEAKKLGASLVFSAATAGMGDRVEKLYVRLFQRYGYNVLGRVLVKEI